MKSEVLDLLLIEKNGFIKTSDAVAFGVSKEYFGDYARKNGLERVARGLYMARGAWYDAFYVIQTRYPKAVFSHETAAYLLGLAEREPTPFSVTLKAGANTAGLKKDGVKVYRIKEELFDAGVTEANSPAGRPLRIYNAERTICDLFRSRSGIDIQDLQSAVKAYIRLKEKNIPLLLRYAKALRVGKFARQYLEALL